MIRPRPREIERAFAVFRRPRLAQDEVPAPLADRLAATVAPDAGLNLAFARAVGSPETWYLIPGRETLGFYDGAGAG